MDNEFEKKLDFDSDTFEDMKRDMTFVLQRLIDNKADASQADELSEQKAFGIAYAKVS